jgi:antitoxin (DNA-binding transcriptional repressor) of toxin-antitoxin stability system
MDVDVDRLITVTEASNKGVSRLAADAEAGEDWILLRGGKPVAGVIGFEKLRRFTALEQIEQRFNAQQEEIGLMVVGLARFITQLKDAVPLGEVLERYGLGDADVITP